MNTIDEHDMTDLQREQAISECSQALQATGLTLLERRGIWTRMVHLITGRSLETIARLEAEKGLEREIRTVRAA